MLNTLWTEKYRPTTLNGYVFSDPRQKAQLEQWIQKQDVPHVLFSGGPGTGKTTAALILVNELNIDPYDFLFINASRENDVDNMRNRITNFVSTTPFGRMKIVLLDECLEENTEIVVLREGTIQLIKIREVNPVTDLVKSFNLEQQKIEWKSFQLFNKGVQETLEIEFENGTTVICTPDHKWYVEDEDGKIQVIKASELEKYQHILTTFSKL